MSEINIEKVFKEYNGRSWVSLLGEIFDDHGASTYPVGNGHVLCLALLKIKELEKKCDQLMQYIHDTNSDRVILEEKVELLYQRDPFPEMPE